MLTPCLRWNDLSASIRGLQGVLPPPVWAHSAALESHRSQAETRPGTGHTLLAARRGSRQGVAGLGCCVLAPPAGLCDRASQVSDACENICFSMMRNRTCQSGRPSGLARGRHLLAASHMCDGYPCTSVVEGEIRFHRELRVGRSFPERQDWVPSTLERQGIMVPVPESEGSPGHSGRAPPRVATPGVAEGSPPARLHMVIAEVEPAPWWPSVARSQQRGVAGLSAHGADCACSQMATDCV